MSEYKAGQRVRIEWPNGSAVEGVLTTPRYGGSPSVAVPRAGGETTLWQPGAQVADNRVVTILSEPRPDEPTGLGAVVEASWRDRGRELFVRARRDRYQWRPEKEYSTTNLYVPWDDLIDPVVLSEGWTP